MAVGRAARRADRRERVVAAFGEEGADVALDLFDLIEPAWHDCYGEVTPPEAVIDDMLILGEGSIERLIRAALLGIVDWRDLRVAADKVRDGS